VSQGSGYTPFSRTAYSWPLRANMMSCIKPEVHNVSQRHQRQTELANRSMNASSGMTVCTHAQFRILLSSPMTHTHPFNGPLSGNTRVGRYQKGQTDLDFTEARDSEWQRHQLGHMQVCTSLQTDNHTSTQPLNFLQAGCPSCRPTNSVKALKA